MKKFKSLLVALLPLALLFSASSALATVSDSGLWVPNSDDLSVSYLGQIFGSVGSALSGSGTQMLGHLFGMFSKGIMVVAVVWLTYSTILIALRSAQEGSFMGANKNIAMFFLRVAMGFALIVPSPGTGYNVAQYLVMKTVVASAGLADHVWNEAATYLGNGGMLYVPHQASSDGFQELAAPLLQTVESSKDLKSKDIVQSIFASSVCMLSSGSYNADRTKHTNNNAPYVKPNINYPTSYSLNLQPPKDGKPGIIYFPGYHDQGSSGANDSRCGSVIAYHSKNSTQDKNLTSWKALLQLVQDILPAAQNYVDSKKNGTDFNKEEVANTIASGVMAYINTIKSVAKKDSHANKQAIKALQDDTENAGWVMAGSYYWYIAKANNINESSKLKNYVPSIGATYKKAGNLPGASSDTEAVQGTLAGIVQGSVSEVYDRIGKDSDTENTTVWGVINQYQSAIGVGKKDRRAGSIGTSIASAAGSLGPLGFLSKVIVDVYRLFNDFTSMSPNPVQALMTLGQDCLNVSLDLWLIGFTAMVALGGILAWCDAEGPGGIIQQTISGWVKPLIIGLSAALLVPGFILAYYLPLFPFILFSFSVIGWLMLVIESMIAMPLVCVGLTHPEGHDFLGKAEQALMLLLGILVRPTLMIIGLVAGMLLSYVAFRFITYGFIEVLHNVFNTSTHGSVLSGSWAAATVNMNSEFLIVFILLLILFASVVYQITKHCFSLIHALPDNVMQWIGSPARQDPAANLAKEMEGTMKGAAKSTGEMGSSGGAAMGQTAGSGLAAPGKSKFDAHQKEKENSAKVGGSGKGDK